MENEIWGIKQEPLTKKEIIHSIAGITIVVLIIAIGIFFFGNLPN